MISLILALLFAIPTYGISILLWIIWIFFKSYLVAKSRIKKINEREFIKQNIIQPSLGVNSEVDFFNSLDLPLKTQSISEENKKMCIHLVLNFISNNKEFACIFLMGVDRYIRPDGTPGDACFAAKMEKTTGNLKEIHYAVYTAIITLTTRNTLPCFDVINKQMLFNRLSNIRANY